MNKWTQNNFSHLLTHCREGFRRRRWHPTPVLLPGKSQGWRSLVGCSPWGCEESDMTERLHFHFLLSCIGKGNGNPLQCSCLENPRDREPAGLPSMGSQSWTWLKQLSSSSREWFTSEYIFHLWIRYEPWQKPPSTFIGHVSSVFLWGQTNISISVQESSGIPRQLTEERGSSGTQRIRTLLTF